MKGIMTTQKADHEAERKSAWDLKYLHNLHI